MDMQNKMKPKENPNYLSESNRLRKESTKMTKSITASKNNVESNKKRNKNDISNITKNLTKNLKLLMTMRYGTKYSLNKNLYNSKNLLPENQLQVDPLSIQLNLTKIQV